MRKKVLVLVIVLVALLVLPNVARAQDDTDPAETADIDIVLGILDRITVGHVVLGAVAATLVQIIKMIGAKAGLPDGYGGAIALAICAALTAGALAAGYLGLDREAEGVLLRIQEVGDGIIVFLSALFSYQVAKRAQIVSPVAEWQDD